MARGLILDIANQFVVATPFPKFFNLGEIDWYPENERFVISEKCDGALGIVYFHDNSWHISTRGSFYSDQAKAGKIYLERMNQARLIPGYTYLVEIIAPETRVVVPYAEEGFVLLSAYDDCGYEVYEPEVLSAIAKLAGIRCVNFEAFRHIDDAINAVKDMPYTQEGFVIRFSGGHRLKVKSPAYLEKHRAVMHFGPLRIWEWMLEGKNPEDEMKVLPEEYWPEIRVQHDAMEELKHKYLDELEYLLQKTKDLADKELALKLSEYQPPMKHFLFARRKKDLYRELQTVGTKARRSFFDLFRPSGNKA
jgi:RNA ligase